MGTHTSEDSSRDAGPDRETDGVGVRRLSRLHKI